MNSGDTAWILVSTALVMLMTPGVALFYGGMVRKKNLISTLMMSFAVLALVSILWVVFGYTLAFGPDIAGFVGGLDFLGLKDVGMEATSYSIPDLLYMMFQGVFAVITVALITGAVVERIKFSTLMVFAVAWLALIYGPVAHWVWGGGWLAQLGALDFAGGTVVHINAGVSAAALVVLLGARKGLGKEPMEPNNIPMVMLGAALLWFGWFGFNAGSSLGANGGAANAFVTTNTAAAAAALVWIMLSWRTRKPTLLGAVTGAVAGLVAITPAAGFVSPMAAIAIGAVAAGVCYFAMNFKAKIGFDDSLDVMSVHGVGGIWGALATGIFATAAIGGVDGALSGNLGQLWNQIIAVGAVMAYSFIGTLVIGKILDKTMGLRVKELEEVVGLDLSQHGERAYGGIK
ncbi:ammonium transporter [Dehalogenimonas alkenigignens]|uniref:Ammonium transporter n=1 Tax=Dehalogenimonas alkenigignens TaxID=1217799 RepID=A0A0W0GIL7_9CHLR|nr:ammonium transporter [Dehalogenimonas alkenigignens]KTB48413.1 ammonium transporter [Dehalogenimonas alkenigignens]PVV85257.1 ammonium transporter [Dehalogenimonas alkenigignens]